MGSLKRRRTKVAVLLGTIPMLYKHVHCSCAVSETTWAGRPLHEHTIQWGVRSPTRFLSQDACQHLPSGSLVLSAEECSVYK